MYNKFSNKKNRKKTNYISDINVTPFVDVLLVLLIVFMITAPILTGSVDIDLPNGDSSKQIKEKTKPVVVSITKKEEIIISDSKVAIDDIKKALIEATSNDLNQKIYIKGDVSVDYGFIMNIIKSINESGFSKVILVTNISK